MKMNNNNTGGTFRVKRNPFTQVSNAAIRDNSMSLKAKGLYTLIQSYITIPNFILYKGHLITMCKEKEKAFNSAWKELKERGYLKQYRIPKGENDTFVYEYELLDIADLTRPSLINLNKNGEVIEVNAENPTHKEENAEPNQEPKDENSHTPHFVPNANGTICEGYYMPNGGGNNNTDDSYIDISYTGFEEDYLPCIYTESSQVKSSQVRVMEESGTDKNMTDNDMTDNASGTQQVNEGIKKELSQSPANQSKREMKSSTNDFKYITYSEYEAIVKKNINYSCFIKERQPYIKIIDTIVSNVLGILIEPNEFIVLNKKENKRIRTSDAKEICLKLKYEHIIFVLEKVQDITTPITNKGSYLKTLILSSLEELEVHYLNQIRQGLL